jgi:hypothetical protein
MGRIYLIVCGESPALQNSWSFFNSRMSGLPALINEYNNDL